MDEEIEQMGLRATVITAIFGAIAILALVGMFAYAVWPQSKKAVCGTERWAVKTLADPQGEQTAARSPRDTTVAQLTSFPAIDRKTLLHAPATRFPPAELTVYEVHAVMLGFKRESDDDFHIVIADPKNLKDTMIVEIPAGACVPGPDQAAFASEQAAFAEQFGKPTAKYKALAKPIAVEVRGVGFYDFIHGQTGVAKNGFELHPVLGISKE